MPGTPSAPPDPLAEAGPTTGPASLIPPSPAWYSVVRRSTPVRRWPEALSSPRPALPLSGSAEPRCRLVRRRNASPPMGPGCCRAQAGPHVAPPRTWLRRTLAERPVFQLDAAVPQVACLVPPVCQDVTLERAVTQDLGAARRRGRGPLAQVVVETVEAQLAAKVGQRAAGLAFGTGGLLLVGSHGVRVARPTSPALMLGACPLSVSPTTRIWPA